MLIQDTAFLQSTYTIRDYKVLGNWDRYHIDEEDVADFVGLDNCKFEEAYNVK